MDAYKVSIGFLDFVVNSSLDSNFIENAIWKEKELIPINISPSLNADISFSVSEKLCADPIISIYAPIAVGHFMLECRGLPLDELAVEYKGKNKIVRKSENNGKIRILTHKCKELCTNKLINIENTELGISEYLCENITVRLAESSDLSMIRDEMLSLLLYREKIGSSDIAAFFSVRGKDVFIKSLSNTKKTAFADATAAIAAAAHIFSRGGRREITVSSEKGKSEFSAHSRGIMCYG